MNKSNPHKHYMLRDQARELVGYMTEQFDRCGVKYYICGSYRRGADLVGDLDFLIINSDLDLVSTILHNIENDDSICINIKFLAEGTQKVKVEYSAEGEGIIEIDFRAIIPCQLGSMLLHFTGPREFNIKMRRKALSQGWSLNEYGLHKLDGSEDFTSSDEADIFIKLGMNYVEPEKRR